MTESSKSATLPVDLSTFEVAAGTTPGTEHTRLGRNNQDAFCVRRDDRRLVVVVCDGCSSSSRGGSHNEIGAQIGAQIVASRLWQEVARDPSPNWSHTRDEVVAALKYNVWRVMGWDRDLVADMLLFTIVAAVITPERASFAAIGDGAAIINGERVKLGPFPNNAPPYIGYSLVESAIPRELLDFNVFASMSTDRLQNFLLGTDGTDDLIRAWDKVLPNGQPVGVVDRLWTDDRFFRNPDVLRRHLMLANGGIGHSQPGYLPDDTTLVVGRGSFRG